MALRAAEERAEAQRYNRLKEAAWSALVIATQFEYDPADKEAERSVEYQRQALRRLANLIDFPGWHSL